MKIGWSFTSKMLFTAREQLDALAHFDLAAHVPDPERRLLVDREVRICPGKNTGESALLGVVPHRPAQDAEQLQAPRHLRAGLAERVPIDAPRTG